ncbi:translation initiation factor IF-2 [Candidatus Babeliales bacterium]|nr:translation initiation factor IF-2 [Candidatus Babeliales bacterium]
MRLYEFSQEVGVTSKDLLKVLDDAGFPVKSHMSQLTDEALVFLKKKFSSEPQVKEVVQSKPVQVNSTYVTKEVDPISLPKEEDLEEESSHIILQEMTVDAIAQKLNRPVTEVILFLLRRGVVATKNQLVSEDLIKALADQYGFEVRARREEKRETHRADETKYEHLQTRLPVIVVMGHVDHGKTTLLDYIRKTRVVAREKGGITQHLGAYHVDTPHGGLVFLDTPGHEAFSQMRARGAKAADIAILIVAADDSVKPQTVEALRHAEAMGIPILVAVNKIDRVDPQRIDVVKRDLAQYNLLPEEWGGQTIFIPISAKEGTGVADLLEVVALQAEMMELQADPTVPAQGFVLEARLQKGRGAVATVICHQGTLKIGDYFMCGATQGKVITLINSYGKKVSAVAPSIPVLVSGFEQLPDVGAVFRVVPEKEYRKARTETGDTAAQLSTRAFDEKTINLIIKAEGNSSREALLHAIKPLSKKTDKHLNIIYSGVGDINESDVATAVDTGARIIGFHVKADTNAARSAHRLGVVVELYDVIYHLIDALKDLLEKSKDIVLVKKRIGEVEVRKVFDIKGLGVIAGCYVRDGKVTRDCTVVISRNGYKVGEGPVRSLQRDRRPMKEVAAGYECAFLVDGFNEWQVGDRVECFVVVPKE